MGSNVVVVHEADFEDADPTVPGGPPAWDEAPTVPERRGLPPLVPTTRGRSWFDSRTGQQYRWLPGGLLEAADGPGWTALWAAERLPELVRIAATLIEATGEGWRVEGTGLDDGRAWALRHYTIGGAR